MLLNSEDREQELRAHIHSLLSQYAIAHLASDYVAWTQTEVANALSDCLRPIPMTEKTAVALPLDPLEVLSQRWNLPQLDVYEERWKVTEQDTVIYLKRQMTNLHDRAEGAEKHWKTEDDDAYDAFLLRRPLSPILSSRARQETLSIGQSAFTANLPQSNKQLLRRCSVKKAREIVIKEDLIDSNEILGNKLSMDAETHRGVLSLMKVVPTLAKSSTISAPHHVEGFLRSDSPPPDLPEFEVLPVFSRGERLGQKSCSNLSSASTLNAVSQLPDSILPLVKIREEDEEDLAEEHLVVVDGWQAFKSSLPSTPSLADSSSEVDELFMPSSPGMESFRLDQLQMEEPQMPRSERIGGACGEPSLPGQGNKLSEFLTPLVRPAPHQAPRIVHSPRSQPSSPRTSITMSMLGLPPTVPDVVETITGPLSDDAQPSSDDSIAFAVKTVEHTCGDRLGSEDPMQFILQDKLDGKDGMLMDVPLLRPPNEHPVGPFVLPSRLADLLASTKTFHRDLDAERQTDPLQKRFSGNLKKVKGLRPLQIELSWIPFKYGRTIPTGEEVADVQNDPCPQLAKSIDLAQDEIVSRLSVLLDESMAFGSQPVSAPSSDVWHIDGQEAGDTVDGASYEDERTMILTRQDRRRLSGLPSFPNDLDTTDDNSQHSGDMSSPNKQNVAALLRGNTNDAQDDRGRPPKRVRFQDTVDDELGAGPMRFTTPHEENGHLVDDSGVFLYDSDSDRALDGMRSSFGQLAYDSEGFEGPSADGDLFLDVHPLHSGDYCFDDTPDPYLGGFLPPYGLDTGTLGLLRSDRDIPDGDGRHEEEREPTAAHPPFHQPATHDARALLPPSPASLPAPLCSPTAVLSTLTERQPATVGLVLSGSPDVRGCARTKSESSVSSARQSLSNFLTICGKGSLAHSGDTLRAPASTLETLRSPPGVLEVQAATPAAACRSKETPPELIDNRTLVLAARYDSESPSVGHLYMASLELIQKRALVRALASVCAVDLVEREHLGPDAENVHLILDCDTAVLFVSVESLPSRGDAVVAALTRLSWRFSRLLVVFECYPSSWGYKGDEDFADKHVASAWSPPVVKAVKKLRRDLAIAEGMQTKRAATIVEYAFARTTEEAAVFARMYGDTAEARDETGGTLWGERLWLTYDERDAREYDLGGVDGMNIFVASLLLSQTTLEEFLEKSTDDRLLEYADLVGVERMTRFNVEMARRLEAMQLPPSSPMPIDTSSSLRDMGDSDLDMY